MIIVCRSEPFQRTVATDSDTELKPQYFVFFVNIIITNILLLLIFVIVLYYSDNYVKDSSSF